jgi:hypothetical protein
MGLATDPLGRVVLFGGDRNFKALQDTWTWDGRSWSVQQPELSPPRRTAMMMTYDEARHEVLLFGGTNLNRYFNDTWTWDGSSWTEQHPLTSPRPMCCSGMAYDAATKSVVLFDGFLGETWTWDGSEWTKQDPARAPVGREFPGMARASAHILLTGGGGCFEDCSYAADTWNWNGITWAKRHPSISPGARWNAAMAYNPPLRVDVLFGGENEHTQAYVSDETWTWDGAAWTKEAPAHRPPARSRSGLAYDPTHQVLVLFGGEVFGGQARDTWTWNGIDWACVADCHP